MTTDAPDFDRVMLAGPFRALDCRTSNPKLYVAMAFERACGRTYPEIGRMFGRARTTAQQIVREFQSRMRIKEEKGVAPFVIGAVAASSADRAFMKRHHEAFLIVNENLTPAPCARQQKPMIDAEA